jgi:hypothetical protein
MVGGNPIGAGEGNAPTNLRAAGEWRQGGVRGAMDGRLG